MTSQTEKKYSKNRDLYKHRSLYNINHLYKSADKCDDERQLKYIRKASMVSNTKDINYGSPMSVSIPGTTKKHSARE